MTESLKIAIVDHHQLFAEGLAQLILKQANYQIQTFYDSQSFLKSPTLFGAQLLFLDIDSAGVNGLSIALKLKSVAPYLKIIILSIYTDAYHLQSAIKCKVDGYLTKRSSTSEIFQSIDRVCRNMKYYSADVQEFIHKKSACLTFSNRELQILKVLSEGFSSREAGERLMLGYETIETHKRSMLRKSKTKNLMQLVNFARKHQLI